MLADVSDWTAVIDAAAGLLYMNLGSAEAIKSRPGCSAGLC